jgi:dTDP-4-amino-4,6-dideoxygalactose transaminase
VPLHLQGAFASLGHGRGDFPAAEAAAAEVLSLPIFPGITAAQQERVAAALAAALA